MSTPLFSLGWALDTETESQNSNEGCTAKRQSKYDVSGEGEAELEGPAAILFEIAFPEFGFNGLSGDLKYDTESDSDQTFAEPTLCCDESQMACGDLLDNNTASSNAYGGHLFAVKDLTENGGHFGPATLDAKLAVGGGGTYKYQDKYQNTHEDPVCPNPSPPDNGTETTTSTLTGDVQVQLIGTASFALGSVGACIQVKGILKGCASGSSSTTSTWPPQPPSVTQSSSGPIVGAVAEFDLSCDGAYCEKEGISPGLCTTTESGVCFGYGWLLDCHPIKHVFTGFDPNNACGGGSSTDARPFAGGGGSGGVPVGGSSSGGSSSGSGSDSGASGPGCPSVTFSPNPNFTPVDIPIEGGTNLGSIHLGAAPGAASASLVWPGGATVPLYTGAIVAARAVAASGNVIIAVSAAASVTNPTNVVYVATIPLNGTTLSASQTTVLPCADLSDVGLSPLTNELTVRWNTVDSSLYAGSATCSGLAWNGSSLTPSSGACSLSSENGAVVTSACYTGSGVMQNGAPNFSNATPVCPAGDTCVVGFDGTARCGCTPLTPDQCTGGLVCLPAPLSAIDQPPSCQSCTTGGSGGTPGECCDFPCAGTNTCQVDSHGVPYCG